MKYNNQKMVDLKERTFNFAVDVRRYVQSLRANRMCEDDCKQLIRSSGSVGANFIEAIEGLSKKDFIYRVKICLKEARESRYWLMVIAKSKGFSENQDSTYQIQESKELIMIFSSIIHKNQKK